MSNHHQQYKTPLADSAGIQHGSQARSIQPPHDADLSAFRALDRYIVPTAPYDPTPTFGEVVRAILRVGVVSLLAWAFIIVFISVCTNGGAR